MLAIALYQSAFRDELRSDQPIDLQGRAAAGDKSHDADTEHAEVLDVVSTVTGTVVGMSARSLSEEGHEIFDVCHREPRAVQIGGPLETVGLEAF